VLSAAEDSSRLEQGIEAARRGDCKTAVADLRSSLPANSSQIAAINALAVCEAQLGHAAEAAAEFQHVVKLDPGAWQGWSNLGASWISASHPERAIEPLQRATKLASGAPAPWFHLGLAYRALDQQPQAFRAFDRAQQLAPKDPEIVKAWLDAAGANATRAADLIEQHDYIRARDLLAPLSRPFEKTASWHNLLGYAEFKLGHPQPALDHLQKAIALEPQNEDYLLDLGEFLGYYRASKQALDLFEVASKRLANSVRVQAGLAVSYILVDRRDDAVRILEPLIAAHGDYEPAYRALGECYEDAGNWDALGALGKKLQAVNPSNPLGWYFEGAALLRRSGETDAPEAGALAALERASALDPSSDRIHFALAKACQRAGQDERAIHELQTTIRLNPRHEQAHYVMARLYQKRGQPELARHEMALHSTIKQQDRMAQYRSLLITSHTP
jgi:tetratricopeptide (TPR) repeat protein